MTTILRPWVPGHRTKDQAPSRQAADDARAAGYTVDEITCRRDTDWADAFADAWADDVDELTILEHDVAPTVAQLDELHACTTPAAACVFAYQLWPSTEYNASAQPVWVHRRLISGDARLLMGSGLFVLSGRLEDHPEIPRTEWIDDGTEWADLAGFGLIRFRFPTRDVTLPNLDSWRHLDTKVSAALCSALGRGWCHVHWPPVQHHHPGPGL